MYRLTVQYDAPADPAEFDRRYFDQHVPLCRALPGLAAASFSGPTVLGSGSAPYLVAELDFVDVAAFKAAMESPEMAAVARDAKSLPASRTMFTGEVFTDRNG